MRFFALQGRHDSRINVKFGTPAVPNFTLLGDIWRFPAQKTRKFAQKFPKLQTFRPAGANLSPDFSEIYVLYARNPSTQCIKIWCDGSFPPKCLKPPSCETTGRTQKVKVGPKMVRTRSIHMPSLVAICRRTAAREEKMGVFCLFFLFVILCICGL